MIRLFEMPRFYMLWFLMFIAVFCALNIWFHASESKHKEWLTKARIPVISGVLSCGVTLVVLTLLFLFD